MSAFSEWLLQYSDGDPITNTMEEFLKEAFNVGMERSAEIVENQYERDGSIDQYEAAEAIRKEIDND